MTHESPKSDELFRLLSELADDTLTDSEVERLRDLLRDDPQAQDLYRKYMRIHAKLHSSGGKDLTRRSEESDDALEVTLSRIRQQLMLYIAENPAAEES